MPPRTLVAAASFSFPSTPRPPASSYVLAPSTSSHLRRPPPATMCIRSSISPIAPSSPSHRSSGRRRLVFSRYPGRVACQAWHRFRELDRVRQRRDAFLSTFRASRAPADPFGIAMVDWSAATSPLRGRPAAGSSRLLSMRTVGTRMRRIMTCTTSGLGVMIF
jgi:hypothetical protein